MIKETEVRLVSDKSTKHSCGSWQWHSHHTGTEDQWYEDDQQPTDNMHLDGHITEGLDPNQRDRYWESQPTQVGPPQQNGLESHLADVAVHVHTLTSRLQRQEE